MKEHFNILVMRIFIQMVYSFRIESRSPTNNTVDFVAFVEEEFGKVGAVLAGYACD